MIENISYGVSKITQIVENTYFSSTNQNIKLIDTTKSVAYDFVGVSAKLWELWSKF